MPLAPGWMRSNEVVDYIIDAYIGEEEAPTNKCVRRRLFRWSEDGVVLEGNAEAFVLHLGRRFERKVSTSCASNVHRVMRELGESVTSHKKHDSPRPDSPKAGKFCQPEPDEWVVARPRIRRIA